MKRKLNPTSGRKEGLRHRASNAILITILLLIPMLHKPVSRQQGAIRIIFEKQRAGGLNIPPLTIRITVKDELVPVGYVTFLLLLFSCVRRRENDAFELDDPDYRGMVMDDEAVLAAWEEVKQQLSKDERT
jgi:hypothetical protein